MPWKNAVWTHNSLGQVQGHGLWFSPAALFSTLDTKEIHDYFRVGMAVNLVLSVLVSAGLSIFDESIIRIFNQNQDILLKITR